MNWNADILRELPSPHRRAFKYNLAAQCLLFLMASLALDEGYFATTTAIVVAAYWIGCVIIVRHRYPRLVASDLLFFRWGFLGAALLGAILCQVVIAWRYR